MSQSNTFTKQGDFNAVLGTQKVAKLLKKAESYSILPRFALVQEMEKNKGGLITWRRLVPLVAKTQGLLEGVTPPPMSTKYEFITQQIGYWGGWMNLTEQVEDLFEDPIVDDAIEEFGEVADRTRELILWGTIAGGTQVIYANGTSTAAINTPVTYDLVQEAVKILKKNRAKMIYKQVKPGPGIATEPVSAAYVAVGPIEFERDIREMNGFVPVHRYSNPSSAVPHELGTVDNVRFILSPDYPVLLGKGAAVSGSGMISQGGTNVDVGQLVVFGEDYFAHVPLKSRKSVQILVSDGVQKSDPLDQRKTIGWKMAMTAVRLNERWGVRIEAAFSDPFGV